MSKIFTKYPSNGPESKQRQMTMERKLIPRKKDVGSARPSLIAEIDDSNQTVDPKLNPFGAGCGTSALVMICTQSNVPCSGKRRNLNSFNLIF